MYHFGVFERPRRAQQTLATGDAKEIAACCPDARKRCEHLGKFQPKLAASLGPGSESAAPQRAASADAKDNRGKYSFGEDGIVGEEGRLEAEKVDTGEGEPPVPPQQHVLSCVFYGTI